jgi:hypothetical protein
MSWSAQSVLALRCGWPDAGVLYEAVATLLPRIVSAVSRMHSWDADNQRVRSWRLRSTAQHQFVLYPLAEQCSS